VAVRLGLISPVQCGARRSGMSQSEEQPEKLEKLKEAQGRLGIGIGIGIGVPEVKQGSRLLGSSRRSRSSRSRYSPSRGRAG
jgi:hypothetical protein